MAASGGKHLLLQYNNTGSTYTTLGGLRTKSMVLNNEMIDVTNHGSNEYREILASAGIKSMSVSGGGVYVGDATTAQALEAACLSGALVNLKVIDTNNSRSFTAAFKVTSWELSGEYNAEAAFSMSAESSGTITVGTT